MDEDEVVVKHIHYGSSNLEGDLTSERQETEIDGRPCILLHQFVLLIIEASTRNQYFSNQDCEHCHDAGSIVTSEAPVELKKKSSSAETP